MSSEHLTEREQVSSSGLDREQEQEQEPSLVPKPIEQQNPDLATLSAAFPQVDQAVVSAVLIASSGNIERAFDALLGMSDPDYTPEPLPTASSAPIQQSLEAQEQIHADELLARQIALGGSQRRTNRRVANDDQDEPQHSFMDDELPVIKENIIQGFNDTKMKVSSFINNLRNQYIQKPQSAIVKSDESPASVHRNAHRASAQFESDPDAVAVVDDDFEQLRLEDNSSGKALPIKPVQSQETSRWRPLKAGVSDSQKSPFDLGDEDD